MKIFNEAKEKTFKIEVQNIIKAAEQGYASSVLKGNVEDTVYSYTDGEQDVTGNITMNLSGKKIQNGEISITKTGKISIAIHNGKYCAVNNLETNEIILEEKPVDECTLGYRFVCGDIFTDIRDSNEYETVQIGDQCWLKENLKYTGNGCLSKVWNSSAPYDACRTHSTS